MNAALKYLQGALVVFILLFIGYAIYLSAWYPLHGDISFNTDIARDFLLFENIVTTHKLTLLGPRSGGISGFFHGPLWIYLNVPAFILGKGNPVVVGWFWVFLSVLSVLITGIVGSKLFNKTAGLLAALLLALSAIDYTHSLFNPFGAVLLFPVVFYFYVQFVRKFRVLDLVALLFFIGCSIQFQIAFAGPILFLVTLHVLYLTFKKRRYMYLLSYLVLLIPLSTYILFEVRHQFLQTKAIIDFVTSSHQDAITASTNRFQNRFEGIIHSLVIAPYASQLVTLTVIFVFGLTAWNLYRNNKTKSRDIYFLFGYLFAGYWLISFLFKGIVWGYYYWPFLPVTIILFSSLFTVINKKIAFLGYVYIALSVLFYYQATIAASQGIIGKDTGSWVFNDTVAKKVFADAPSKFGYYVFSPDEFGYSPQYAMHYEQRLHPQKTADAYQKDTVTYLLLEPGIKGDLNAGTWWTTHRVGITKDAVRGQQFGNGFRIEKYMLTDEEVKVPSDPNIVHTLIFR